MPREREFDPTAALEQAMYVFWRKGYADTSIDDLVAETGVSRYGLYGTFGGKRRLYLAALDHYRDTLVTAFLDGLEAPEAGLAEVRNYFDNLIAVSETPDGRLGCLMCVTAVDLAPHDDEMAAKVRAHFTRLETALENALANARDRGEIGAGADPAALATFLTGIVQGGAVYGRARCDRRAVETYVNTALSVLE